MINKDIIKYSVMNLWKRKLRSSLTILSILIGITAIFALVSFGQGINKYVNELAKVQGIDKVMLLPKDYISSVAESKFAFTDDDVNFVSKIKGVDEIAAFTIASGKIKFKDYKEAYTFFFGFPTDPVGTKLISEFMTVDMAEGRNVKSGDVLNAVLGYNYQVPDKIFKRAVSVGDTVLINDVPVKVVGFFGAIGNPGDDSQVYMTKAGFEKIFGKKNYEYVIIRSAKDTTPAELSDKIKEKFRKHRNEKEGQEDFVVQTYEEVLKTFTTVITIINGMLILIALISIVVASVNTANTMYTSILERTQEIGVMKAIGAQNSFILLIFVIESGLLGLIGGILGVSLGFGVAKIGEYVAAYYGISMLKPAFPIWLTVGCLLFAFLVGAGSGMLPAIQASKLKPVDALRYE